ncbi:translation initiation factor IF-2-like [Alexandromys fortis]|uniref:translation initiation factor IF-2-like n=1 Tax=Alexandromys fortis TaxID=100897 RepID=UPI002152299D|nr:translation initiation factor IF-2-like [Microtus fortis]
MNIPWLVVGVHSPGPKLVFGPRFDSNSQEPQPSSFSGTEHHRPSLTPGLHPVSPAPTPEELARPRGGSRLELKFAASIPHAGLSQHCSEAAAPVVLRPGPTLIPPQPTPWSPVHWLTLVGAVAVQTTGSQGTRTWRPEEEKQRGSSGSPSVSGRRVRRLGKGPGLQPDARRRDPGREWSLPRAAARPPTPIPAREPGSATSPQAAAPALPVRPSELEGTWSAKLPALPVAASAPRLRDPRPQSVRPGARREPEPPPLTHRGAPSRVPDARPTLTAAAPSAGWTSPSPSPTAGPRTPGRAAAATSPAATATTAPAADATPRPGLAPHASRLTPSGARLLESSPLALA